MTERQRRLLGGMFRHMAQQEIDPRQKLADLERAQKLDPLDEETPAWWEGSGPPWRRA